MGENGHWRFIEVLVGVLRMTGGCGKKNRLV